MSLPSPKLTLLDRISRLCDDNSSFQARFALTSFPNNSSSIISNKILLILESIQLVSPLLVYAISLGGDQYPGLLQTALFIARLMNPAFWMSFNKTGDLELMTFIATCSLSMAKFFLMIYILCKCTKASPNSGLLVTLWRFIMKFQCRFIYFSISYFYINAIRVVNWETLQPSGDQNKGIIIVSEILITFELGLALIPKILYHCIFPTKDFLSSKDNTLEIVILAHKVVVQTLTSALDLSISSNNWIFTVVNLCFEVFKIGSFVYKLPLYSFKALQFQGRLLMIIAGLNFSSFIFLIGRAIDKNFEKSFLFIMIFWAILSLLGIRVIDNFLKKMFWRVLCDPELDSPHLLIHRIVIIKRLQESSLSNNEDFEPENRSHFSNLIQKTLNLHFKKIFWVNNDVIQLDSMVFKNFLETVKEKFPENQFIQIFLAEFYFKTIKIYSDPIKISLALKKTGQLNIRLNAELLLIRIQNKVQNSKFKTLSMLDVANYVYECSFVSKLKQEMLKQISNQVQICSEIMKGNPDLELIYQESQQAHENRKNVLQKISLLSKTLSDFNLEPLILSAQYYLSLNHSIKEYLDLTKLYSQKLTKYQKIFSQEQICPQNIFQENVGFVFVSGLKGEAGKITYATKSVEGIVGGDSTQFAGTHIVQKAPPIYRPILYLSFSQISEDPEDTYIGKITRTFYYHINLLTAVLLKIL